MTLTCRGCASFFFLPADGDEDDGFDETILPEDYASAGQIVDDVRDPPNSRHAVSVCYVWRHISRHLIILSTHTHTPQDLHKILVKHLPPGVRLTVVFDSCHSGTAMDLPYVYNENGCIDSPSMGTQPGLLWLQLMCWYHAWFSSHAVSCVSCFLSASGKKAKKLQKKMMKKQKKMKDGKGKGKGKGKHQYAATGGAGGPALSGQSVLTAARVVNRPHLNC